MDDSQQQSSGPVNTDTQGCSCNKPAVAAADDLFEKAWKAIENGNVSEFEQAIQEMKSGSAALLNACRVTKGCGVIHTMTLLAFCGFHQRKDMVDLLLKEGADMNADCTCALHGPGKPLPQMVLHCLLNGKLEAMVDMQEYFIQKGAEFSGVITTIHTDEYDIDGDKVRYDILSLLLVMKKIDYAKELVKAGFDPVSGGNPKCEELDVVPMFQEYYEHGTNKFIRWVFNEYIPQCPKIKLRAFTQRLIQVIISMKEKDKENGRWKLHKRTATHAVLTSGHQETIECLIQSGKAKRLDLLAEQSCTGKTALHHAAENNDEGSVDILLQLGADTRIYDHSNMNPFMLAVENGLTHLNVAKAMAKMDPNLVTTKLDSGLTVSNWAQEKGHDAFFKVCSCFDPDETCPPQHQPFKEAWKAIEDGVIPKLKQAIKKMRKLKGGPSTLLNVCRVTRRNGVMYSMTLLALSGFQGRKDMVDLLLWEGADLSASCTCPSHGSGTPLSQMMLHGLMDGSCDKLDVTMLEHMIYKGANLTEMITAVVLDEHTKVQHDMLTLALSMKKIDWAKILVDAGIDPVTGGNPEGENLNVVPMFQEYYDHGTNEFIRWVFMSYIPEHPMVAGDLFRFTKRIIEMIISMKEKEKKTLQWKSKSRTAAHAMLMSGNREITEHLVKCGREKDVDLLAEQSCTGQTALHHAAENNDVLSVNILLRLGADTRAYDNSDMNPFMLAIEKGRSHLDVAKAMVRKDPGLVSLKLSSGLSMTHWALEKGHDAFFKMDNLPHKRSRTRQQVNQFETIFHPVSIESGCSCYDPEETTPDDSFVKAWEAIEDGNISTFEQLVLEMKKSGTTALLNAGRIIKRNGMVYRMSLLALCGFHGRKDMVDLLLREGADMNSKCTCPMHGPGTPVSQMMLHGLLQHQYDRLDVTMLQLFIEKRAKLSGRVAARYVSRDGEKAMYDILSLSLLMGRVDCAKVLVNEGIDPLTGNDPEGESFTVVPMFQEYCAHGTSEYIRWVFNEYIPQHPEVDLKAFTHQIMKTVISMKAKDKKDSRWESKRRTPAHAVLMCRHLKAIEHLVQWGRSENRLDLLAEKNCTSKTALHQAVVNNDAESVDILMRLGADTRAYDYSDRNPFMLAVEKGPTHLNVAKAMMKRDPTLVSLKLETGMTVIHWALEKGHNRNAFFKGCFEEIPSALFSAVDSNGNRIAHLVAASGNTEVIKILWSERFVTSLLTVQNNAKKTALQLAVEKGHIHVLKTLKECLDRGREWTTPRWQRTMKRDWWSKMIPLFLYASSCGSLSAVKYFIDCGYNPNIRYQPKAQDPSLKAPEAQTPLLNAAREGHDEIVAYLLQFRKVTAHLKGQPEIVARASTSPLLVAAKNGHTKCVTHLLQKGAKVLQRDSDGRNCLIFAVQNLHEDTALAILAEKDGLTTLETNHKPAPLQLLIKEMPDVAEFVLNKCITQDDSNMQVGQPVHYNFDYLEKKGSKESPKSQNRDPHILYWMIQNKKILEHPLVKNYLFQKFWGMIFPQLLIQLLFYCMFLVALNGFALILPRPGPDSEICPGNTTGASNGSECHGQSGSQQRFLAAILYILVFAGLLYEFWQLFVARMKYFMDVANYFQVALYILTIIFIFDFDECWCATAWQWQMGALAVFLSWFNFILVLRSMPYTGVPINIFLSICVTFLKLIFLPIMLLLAFGIPFYMIFVRVATGSLVAFRSPGHAIAKTLLQLVGEFDFEATFNQGVLLYSPTTYILFITFLITMPVLFSNLLTALAVGDTQAEREKAEFTKLKYWVEFILEEEKVIEKDCKRVYSPDDEWLSRKILPRISWIGFILILLGNTENRWIRFFMEYFELEYKRHIEIVNVLKEKNENIYKTVMISLILTLLGRDYRPENRCVVFFVRLFGMEYECHVKTANELKERNDYILRTVMAHDPVDTLRKDVTEDVEQEMANFKTEMKSMIKEELEELTTLKTDMKAAKKEELEEPETFKTDVKTVMKVESERLATLKTEMKAVLKEEMATFKTEMKAAMKEEMATVKTDMRAAMKESEELSDTMKTLMQVLTSKMEAMGSRH